MKRLCECYNYQPYIYFNAHYFIMQKPLQKHKESKGSSKNYQMRLLFFS